MGKPESNIPNSQNMEIQVKFVWNFIWIFYAGPYWTHVLFTWTQTDGLMVYINGTFSIGDPKGNVSYNYGDPNSDLVIGTRNTGSYGHYATGAFDEFVIWERALSPLDILLYYKAAIGKLSCDSTSSDLCHFLKQRLLGVTVCFQMVVSHCQGFWKELHLAFGFLGLPDLSLFGIFVINGKSVFYLLSYSTVNPKIHFSHT